MTKPILNFETVQFDYKDTHLTVNKVENLDDLVNQITDDEFNKDERMPYWAELWPSAIGLSRYIKNNTTSLLCTDYENNALILARKNFQKNNIRLPHLKWLDWRNPKLNKKYDIIVASDVLYEERFFQPLQEVFHNYVEEDGQILIAEPNREIAVPFFEMLKNKGYEYTNDFEKVDQGGKTIIVSVYLMWKLK
ncbi:MAG: hypothetical protein P8Y99_18545 [Calditrichaceae bacterium]